MIYVRKEGYNFRNVAKTRDFRLYKYDIIKGTLVKILNKKDNKELNGIIGEINNAKNFIGVASICNCRRYNDNIKFDCINLNKGDEIEIIETKEKIIL